MDGIRMEQFPFRVWDYKCGEGWRDERGAGGWGQGGSGRGRLGGRRGGGAVA